MIFNQRTIKNQITCSGIGLHSGKWINIRIRPAPINYGIRFVRIDLPFNPEIKAIFSNVIDTSLATIVGSNGCVVSTIEHLMSALAAISVDNAIVELDSCEIPVMDGGSNKFIDLLLKSGIKNQAVSRKFFFIKKKIRLCEGDKSISIYPDSGFKVTYSIEYFHPLIQKQSFLFDFLFHSFYEIIGYARTFGFLKEIIFMKKIGLGLGGSLNNAVVLGDRTILNPDGLRFLNEFVRHKILDCMGDFYLLGLPIIGHVVLKKSGHKFNYIFIKELLKKKSFWEIKKL